MGQMSLFSQQSLEEAQKERLRSLLLNYKERFIESFWQAVSVGDWRESSKYNQSIGSVGQMMHLYGFAEAYCIHYTVIVVSPKGERMTDCRTYIYATSPDDALYQLELQLANHRISGWQDCSQYYHDIQFGDVPKHITQSFGVRSMDIPCFIHFDGQSILVR